MTDFDLGSTHYFVDNETFIDIWNYISCEIAFLLLRNQIKSYVKGVIDFYLYFEDERDLTRLDN